MSNRWKLAIAAAVSAAVATLAVITLSTWASEPADATPDTSTTVPTDPTPAPAGTDAERTITVSGHGTVSVVPDTADLMAGVQAQAATATEALDTVGTKSQSLIDTLKDAGIASEDIQTAGLSLYPTYGNERQEITGYQASTSVTATIGDVTKVGDVVDALKSLVGDQLTLQGVSFSYKDPEAVMADARTAALANAKVRAEQYAAAAGVELGGVLRIVETSVASPVMYRELAAAAPAADSAKVAVEPGSQDLAADISVVYEMR
jgi:uncharacterized protein YggE